MNSAATATSPPGVRFGLKTTPMGAATYAEVCRAWQEADAIPVLEHAWLWDHLLPLDLGHDQPCLESWTLLAALAARTERLRLGHLVTNNLNRYPAVLAKMAATVDVISGGRLVFGIGAGGAGAEQEAYGVPLLPAAERIGRLAETCQLVKRLWSEPVVDFEGRYSRLRGARCEPKPVQRPRPPILVGGTGERLTLRVVAEHADVWNMPGPPWAGVDEFRRLSRRLDEQCRALGRDPATLARSLQVLVGHEDPGATVAVLRELIAIGANHIVLAPQPPFPPGTVRRLVDEIIAPVL
jgi:alkanesulfonate monooxygenase SsuD/methylene tetrahydromethanopterin reductase-like flavin-dependent oxidoreductase (luciferase family)